MDAALGEKNVCDFRVTQIHALCMCMIDLPDRHILTILGRVFKKDDLDGIGNSPLYYIAAAGRKEVLQYIIVSGINT
ncbi:predicted protein [Sclerotinia sclerotiorum 1980 UF-70]|uniref:Uncharacterized protein n=1 Tax=Sclerotinia sclerotiorum (strain ATCC 18683 / 1980 / Ss-1) TaxID=665079 RepID=A7F501_SCLS1|nr:predicted protein [Sclerotinia sclerotiorum 1980 UF-70]EDN97822.1 predicted protein [Sclerotinia sclerotiorum 1980 UF-70]